LGVFFTAGRVRFHRQPGHLLRMLSHGVFGQVVDHALGETTVVGRVGSRLPGDDHFRDFPARHADNLRRHCVALLHPVEVAQFETADGERPRPSADRRLGNVALEVEQQQTLALVECGQAKFDHFVQTVVDSPVELFRSVGGQDEAEMARLVAGTVEEGVERGPGVFAGRVAPAQERVRLVDEQYQAAPGGRRPVEQFVDLCDRVPAQRRHVTAGHHRVVHARVGGEPFGKQRLAGARRTVEEEVAIEAAVAFGVLGGDRHVTQTSLQTRLQDHAGQRVAWPAEHFRRRPQRLPDEIGHAQSGRVSDQARPGQTRLGVPGRDRRRPLGRVQAGRENGQAGGRVHQGAQVREEAAQTATDHLAAGGDRLQHRRATFPLPHPQLFQVYFPIFPLHRRPSSGFLFHTLHVVLVLQLQLLFYSSPAYRLLLLHRLLLPPQRLLLLAPSQRLLVAEPFPGQLVLVFSFQLELLAFLGHSPALLLFKNSPLLHLALLGRRFELFYPLLQLHLPGLLLETSQLQRFFRILRPFQFTSRFRGPFERCRIERISHSTLVRRFLSIFRRRGRWRWRRRRPIRRR
ncbi:hypothetical protein T11_8872, partial [Trichinella zimbabwensis]